MATRRKKPVTTQEYIQELEQDLNKVLEMKGLITLSEAQEIRNVTRPAIMSLIERGRIRSVKGFGRTWVYRSDIEKFMPDKPGPKQQYEDIMEIKKKLLEYEAEKMKKDTADG